MIRPPLLRTTDDRLLAGVCGGLARHLGVPATVVRGIMLALTLLGGAGGLLYLWLWVTIPRAGETDPIVPMRRALTRPAAGQVDGEPGTTAARAGSADWGADRGPGLGAGRGAGVASETLPTAAPRSAALHSAAPRSASPNPAASTPASPKSAASIPAPSPAPTPGFTPGSAPDFAGSPDGPAAAPRRVRWPIAELLLGACLLVAGLGLVLVRFGVEINLAVILPAMAVLVGVGLTWWQIADRDRPDRNQVPRVLGALALVAAGVLLFFVTSRDPSAWTVIAAACAVLAGVALAIAPWLLRLNRELIAERAARAREAERSDIAAHLHDSVLQTLALIQQRSEPGSEVSRIARGQERELREWLFRAADGIPRPAREAVGEELRAHAAALEEEHAVRFEIVEVGALGEVPEPLLAAAREAMLNAARHAGGDVTVYVEATEARISIDVTDRGPGLDLAQLPAGRMGVRESILGRMERAGGTARIVPGPGGGTSVRLGIPREDPAPPSVPTEEPSSNE